MGDEGNVLVLNKQNLMKKKKKTNDFNKIFCNYNSFAVFIIQLIELKQQTGLLMVIFAIAEKFMNTSMEIK